MTPKVKIPESRFWSHYIRPALYPAHCTRIENTAGSGVPDVHACYEGKDIWIELKVGYQNGECYIRKMQYVWGLRQNRAGGICYVVSLNQKEVDVWRFPFAVRHIKKYVIPTSEPTYTLLKSQLKTRLRGILFDLQ